MSLAIQGDYAFSGSWNSILHIYKKTEGMAHFLLPKVQLVVKIQKEEEIPVYPP